MIRLRRESFPDISLVSVSGPLAWQGSAAAEVTDDSKWDEMDKNAIANLHLALADGILSSIEELKTPMEMWIGKPVNYSNLHIFGSPMYVLYNSQETTKLDPKSRKCLFLGYADGVKGCRLWDPTAQKIVVNRYVVFMEDKIQENKEAPPEHEVNETNESQAPATRTLNQEGESSTLQEALIQMRLWKATMQEEMEALHKNKTWELMTLPGGRKPIGNKWVYKIKKNDDDQVERYRARLQLDVKTAFLHGNLKEEIYMLQPEGFEQNGKENLVCRILGYIKGTSDVTLCFGESDLIVKGYVDSDYDYAGDIDGSKSEAEYVAAAQASKEAVWLKMLLEELVHEQKKITLFCDNQSALYLARNLAFHSNTKHIRVQYYFVREKVEEGTVDMQKIHTDDNVADYLTKAINCDKFIWCRSSCGLAEM
ncbi:gag-pol polyprotein [Tanacetum coccineum]